MCLSEYQCYLPLILAAVRERDRDRDRDRHTETGREKYLTIAVNVTVVRICRCLYRHDDDQTIEWRRRRSVGAERPSPSCPSSFSPSSSTDGTTRAPSSTGQRRKRRGI